MDRELNSPDEILRRCIFIIYLVSWIAAIVLGVLGIAQSKWQFLIYAGFLSVIGYSLKFYGEKHWDFKRLANSFPHGTPADELSPQLSKKIEQLLHELGSTNADWVRRQELRKELIKLIKAEPILLEIYNKEIACVLPFKISKLHS